MLNAEQIETFEKTGLLHLPGAIARDEAVAMCEAMWTVLDNYGIKKDEPETWTQPKLAIFKKLAESGAFDGVNSKTVCGALDDLMGPEGWLRPDVWGSSLFTVPNAETWQVPTGWHLDYPIRAAQLDVFHITGFVFLNTVTAGGGGTLAVAGSHLVLKDFLTRPDAPKKLNSPSAKKALNKNEPWFHALFTEDASEDRVAKFMSESTSQNGHSIQVVEMTGEPGDVFFLHSGMLHTVAPNANQTPRMMLLSRFYDVDHPA